MREKKSILCCLVLALLHLSNSALGYALGDAPDDAFDDAPGDAPDDAADKLAYEVEDEELNYLIEERPKLFEGDILTSKGPYRSNSIEMLERTRRNAKQEEMYLWPSGVVPIIFEDSYPNDYKPFVLNAMNELEKEVNGDGHCIKVLPISKSESYLDHVRILNLDFCASFKGAQQKRGQNMILGEGCLQLPGYAQHELMHALGFGHEQTRIDRDDYVTIIKENVVSERESNFRKYEGKTFGLPYDYDSILHYPKNAFPIDRSKPTIITKNGESIGNRQSPSEYDIERIRRLYSCSSNGVIAKEKEIETEAGMKEIEFKGGEAKAFSYEKPKRDYGPKRAFSRQTPVTDPYLSGGTMPQAVWYVFPREMTVARFGFRNRREYDLPWNNPVTFSFVGSKDCFKKNARQTELEEIVSVSNTTWPKSDHFQFWDVDKKDRRTYQCFGFLFYDASGQSGHVAIQDVRMWEATPTKDVLTDAETTPTTSEDSKHGLISEEPVQEMLTSEQKNQVQDDLTRIRLVNREGLSNKSGRLEVLIRGQWGSICDDTGDNRRWSAEGHIDSRVSKVVCSMYGYTGVGIVVNEWGRRMTELAKEMGEEFEKMREETGKAPLRWSKLHCKGNEISLFDCTVSRNMRKMWRTSGRNLTRPGSSCKSHEAIGIHCF